MVISDTSCMIDGFTIALLAAEFGQVWAEHVCRDVTAEVKCKIQLNAYNFVAPGATKSHTTLGEILQLYNCAVVDKGFG